MSVSLVKAVSLVKRDSRHAATIAWGEGSYIVWVNDTHDVVRTVVFADGSSVSFPLTVGSTRRNDGPRHLCASFDIETDPSESRCGTPTLVDCGCVVRGSRRVFTRVDGSDIAN